MTQEFIAYVLDYEEESGMATLEVRNNFRGHIAAEVFGPTISATRFELQELYDMDKSLGRCQNTNAENQNPCTPASGKGRHDSQGCDKESLRYILNGVWICGYAVLRHNEGVGYRSAL